MIDYFDKKLLPKEIAELEELLQLKVQKLDSLPKIQENVMKEAQNFKYLGALLSRMEQRETVIQELTDLREELASTIHSQEIASEEQGKKFINEPKRTNNDL